MHAAVIPVDPPEPPNRGLAVGPNEHAGAVRPGGYGARRAPWRRAVGGPAVPVPGLRRRVVPGSARGALATGRNQLGSTFEGATDAARDVGLAVRVDQLRGAAGGLDHARAIAGHDRRPHR